MYFKIAFGLVLACTLCTLGLAKDCMETNYGKSKCLKKSELPTWLGEYMLGGDPCFLMGGNRWCFVTAGGSMNPCGCTPECGCKDAATIVPPPACDNSKVPTSFPTKCGPAWGADNSMCQYTSMGSCGGVCNVGLTADEKKEILDAHNDLRRKVAKGLETIGDQPSASNMNELVWDDELAVSAQRWTNQCTAGHDVNRKTNNYQSVGQNAATSSSSANVADNKVKNYVQMWYDEVKDFDKSVVNAFNTGPPSTGVIGHYTAVVWAKTQKVGCGFVHFKKDGWYTKIINCNYYPAANLIGAPIYKSGTAGADCANNKDGLCGQ